MDVRQSDLASYARCARQKKHADLARDGQGPRPANMSRTVYGTVIHHCVQVLETLYNEGQGERARSVAIATFEHYWLPANLPEFRVHHAELAHGIEMWLPGDTWAGMRDRGVRVLGDYYDLLTHDDGFLLALEIGFRVPLDLGPLGTHHLTGTLDRLAVRRWYGKTPYLSVEDFKTGRRPTYLRYGLQWTIYCFATLQQEFWTEFPDADERWHTYSTWARRGRWIDLRDNKYVDCGWRAEEDYARMRLAVGEYIRAVEADIYPLSVSGDTCLYCPFREVCGGVPVPAEDHGRPGKVGVA